MPAYTGLGTAACESAGYSPDFNAGEAIWGWVREEGTSNLCLGSRAAGGAREGR